MRCKRLGPPEPSEIVQRARRVRARCIAVFHATLEHEAGWESVERARFRLQCGCGAASFRLTGALLGEQAELEGRLSLACTQCGREADVFDPQRDGYNAEIEAGESGAEGPRVAHRCAGCQGGNFGIEVALLYQLDDEELEEGGELASRPQDFFTALTLGASCVACGARTEPASYECA